MVFKEFWQIVESEFLEMARAIKKEGESNAPPRIPTFDDEDQNYFRYIYDNAPEQAKNDKGIMRSLIMRAIFYRYGRPEEGGMLHKQEALTSDYQTITFNLSKGRITIENIPVFPQNVIKKIESLQFKHKGKDAIWNWEDPKFGFGRSNWQPLQKRAEMIIDFFKHKTPITDNAYLYYSPKDDMFKSVGSKEVLRQAQIKSVVKKRDFSEFDVKSMSRMPLDADDQQYLDDIREDFIKNYLDKVKLENVNEAKKPFYLGQGSKSPSAPEQMSLDTEFEIGEKQTSEINRIIESTKILPKALALRYSDHWIKEDENGFNAKAEFTDKSNPNGLTRGQVRLDNVNIKTKDGGRRRELKFENVHLNLPALVKKFEKYKLARNFVKEPMPLARAEWFIDRKSYKPNQGTKFGANEPDKVFYRQISDDHELWRHRGDQTSVRGNPVDSKLAERLTWRRGDTIVQAPNIQDLFKERNPDNFTWQELMMDDAKRAIKGTVQLYARTKFVNNADQFKKEMSSEDTNRDLLMRGLTELTMRKTGVKEWEGQSDPYRRESQRVRWCNAAIERYIEELYKDRASGKDDENPDAFDIAPSKDTGDTINTLKPSTQEEEPERRPPELIMPHAAQAVPEPERESPGEMSQDDLERMQQQPKQAKIHVRPLKAGGTIPKPPFISFADWGKMSDEAKMDAARRAGLIR